MSKNPRLLILAGLLALTVRVPLLAQSTTPSPADAKPAQAGQAPDEATRKISDLVHAGKYTEAQQLTTGLLIAYPDDQRLIKAKALIEKLLVPGGSTSAAPTSSKPAQPAANTNPEQLTGMDKVDYNALIVLARQAQQTTELAEQTKLLKQFMDQSDVFLQKHPEQMLLWQFRVQLAISLNEPMEGYKAGQRLLADGAADSSDPSLQQLLGELKNKGWLDKQEVEKQTQKKNDYLVVLGAWSGHFSKTDHKGHEVRHADVRLDFSKSDSVIEGYLTTNATRDAKPTIRGTILDSGEINWERRWGSDWKTVSVEIGSDKRSMKIVFTDDSAVGQNAFATSGHIELCTFTSTLTKN